MNGMPFFLNPGVFEIIYGAMGSRKTAELIEMVRNFDYYKSKGSKEVDYLLIKPITDTRDEHIKSRSSEYTVPCERVPRDQPYKITEVIAQLQQKTGKRYEFIGIDEIQFFTNEITDVVLSLQLQNKHVVGAGLDRDFRGELFGSMGKLIAMANKVHRRYAVCDFGNSCTIPGTLTQKLINGEPAPYVRDEDVISVQGANPEETYQTRCIKHHQVPGKKESDLVRILKSL